MISDISVKYFLHVKEIQILDGVFYLCSFFKFFVCKTFSMFTFIIDFCSFYLIHHNSKPFIYLRIFETKENNFSKFSDSFLYTFSYCKNKQYQTLFYLPDFFYRNFILRVSNRWRQYTKLELSNPISSTSKTFFNNWKEKKN